jgi:hypothetical protein
MVSSSSVYQLTQRNILEDLNLQQHHYKSLKPVVGHVTVLLWLSRTEFLMKDKYIKCVCVVRACVHVCERERETFSMLFKKQRALTSFLYRTNL